MTLNAAIKIIEKECEFLGKDWDEVMFLLADMPTMFPQSAMEAYKVISVSD